LSGTWVDNLNGISNAENLVELHISNCGLTGPLPSELFDLSSTLKALYMNGNFFFWFNITSCWRPNITY